MTAPIVILASRNLVSEMWATIEPMIEKAIPRSMGRIKAVDVLEGARTGAFDVWLVLEPPHGVTAVGVGEVLEFPQRRVYSAFLYSGERRRAMATWPKIEEHARRLGCHDIQVAGSRAWGRIFPDFREFSVFVKEIV